MGFRAISPSASAGAWTQPGGPRPVAAKLYGTCAGTGAATKASNAPPTGARLLVASRSSSAKSAGHFRGIIRFGCQPLPGITQTRSVDFGGERQDWRASLDNGSHRPRRRRALSAGGTNAGSTRFSSLLFSRLNMSLPGRESRPEGSARYQTPRP